MSLHEAHSTGGDHTLQHVNRKTQGRGEGGGVLETRTNRKGLHTMGISKDRLNSTSTSNRPICAQVVK